MPFAGLDFHCSPICDALARGVVAMGESSAVFQRFGRDCLDGIQRLMWTHWSSVTTKVNGFGGDGTAGEDEATGGFDKLLWDTELEPLARKHNKAFLTRIGL